MPRERLEVADIFRAHGPAWRRARAGHLSLGQLKVMSAIETCRTAALGGHLARCKDCAHTQIAYNSCRNRHCPKCQGATAAAWLAARQAELLPVAYYHVVFTLPAQIADIAHQNKAVVYDILFKTEVIHRRGPWRTCKAVEFATLEWVDWFNKRRLLEPIGNIPPDEAEARFYAQIEELAMVA